MHVMSYGQVSRSNRWKSINFVAIEMTKLFLINREPMKWTMIHPYHWTPSRCYQEWHRSWWRNLILFYTYRNMKYVHVCVCVCKLNMGYFMGEEKWIFTLYVMHVAETFDSNWLSICSSTFPRTEVGLCDWFLTAKCEQSNIHHFLFSILKAVSASSNLPTTKRKAPGSLGYPRKTTSQGVSNLN